MVTATKVYGFNQQLKQGQLSEKMLDDFFSQHGYDVSSMSDNRDVQRTGIDSIFTVRRSGNSFPVEYKTDTLTHKTGNIFIETVSVSRKGRDIVPGWIYTSKAKFLIYAAVQKAILVISFETLREEFKGWQSYCSIRESRNASYSTKGILVPYKAVEECANHIIPWKEYERG